jgi:hypothetical protein
MCSELIKAVKMFEEIKNIDPSKLNDIQGLRTGITLLINAVERLAEENKALKEENRRLRDENNRLKGGNPRPKKKGRQGKDISSKGKELGRPVAKASKDDDQPPPLDIDQEIKVDIIAADLPADAVFKGYACYEQQDLALRRNNKRFLLATYYSPLQKCTITALFPPQKHKGILEPGSKAW